MDTPLVYGSAEIGRQLHALRAAPTPEGTFSVWIWTDGVEFGLFRSPIGS